MATTIKATGNWTTVTETQELKNTNLKTKWLDLADSQTENKTLWFLLSLVVQGVFFLPMPALLSYYYDAPAILLAITLPLFFANVITGMGGAGIRTTFTLFAASVLVHLLMLGVYVF